MASLKVLPTEQYFALVRTQLDTKGEAYVRVTGSSMQPLLHHQKDGVIITKADSYQTGDIVLFDRQNGHYALHRIVHAGKNDFSMMEDHQWHRDRNLPYEQIVGKVSGIIRDEKRISVDCLSIRIYTAFTLLHAPVRLIINHIRYSYTHPGNTIRRN